MLQSWTKSVKNFALSYPQKAYPADRVPLRLLPHPTLVNVVHSGAVIVFGAKARGAFILIPPALESFIVKLKIKTFFVTFFVQDCT